MRAPNMYVLYVDISRAWFVLSTQGMGPGVLDKDEAPPPPAVAAIAPPDSAEEEALRALYDRVRRPGSVSSLRSVWNGSAI